MDQPGVKGTLGADPEKCPRCILGAQSGRSQQLCDWEPPKESRG